MKSGIIISAALLLILLIPGVIFADSIEELIEQYKNECKSLRPSMNSSVNTDYKQEQLVLGAVYSLAAFNLIYQQNQEAMRKENETLDKLDKMIQQNQEIIKLLSILAKKKNKINQDSQVIENKKISIE